MSRVFSVFVSIFLLGFAQQALACPVCGFGQDGTQFAFIFTTGLLTVLPLIMIATIVFLIWRRANRVQDL